jgi:outer membrane protein assembly factor BamA
MITLTKYFRNIATGLTLLLFVITSSCVSTKYVQNDEYLLKRVGISIDNREINKEELNSFVRQKENTRILGFIKFHLWLYNLSAPSKSASWLKRAGEPPQIYSPGLSDQSRDQLTQYMHNKGFYNAKVDYSVKSNQHKKKTNLEYSIRTGDVYRLDTIHKIISDTVLCHLFEKEYSPRYLRQGEVFDLDLLDRERDYLVEFYKNLGYFYFSKSLIYFEADTTFRKGYANLRMVIGLPFPDKKDSLRIFKPYRFDHFTYKISHNLQGEPEDTILRPRNTYIFPKNMAYKPSLFERLNKMAADSLYKVKNSELTFNALNRLRQFRYINFNFQEVPSALDSAQLNCTIDLSPLSKQSASFDIEGTNTSGNFGIAGNLNYSHKNLFRGAETVNLKLKGAMERQQAILKNEALDFNTREMGVEATLIIPKLIGPGSFFPSFANTLPKTLVTLGYNFQRRPDYTRRISTLRLGYEWMTSEYKHHSWNIMDFNMVNLSRFDPDFINFIYDLYIRESFTDHLILATNYSFVYNTQPLLKKENYSYIKYTVESSGNLLFILSLLSGANKITETDTSGLKPVSYYQILDTRYAQYLKSDIEFRRGYMIDKYNSVVGRLFFGAGLPYGNFKVLPFEKKYFTGGANGIRAWQVRSLGPGTYSAPEGSYPNQSGDIKLEGNIEYRFKLIKYLEGAFFLDVGNVWAINEKDNRQGAQFYLGQFYKQFAVGTGTGFRFDFTYFIFRLDLGIKMRDPAQPEHHGWITGARKLTGNDLNLSFAIGYPF